MPSPRKANIGLVLTCMNIFIFHIDIVFYMSMQFGESICGHACGKQSRPGALPAIAPCFSMRLDLPTLCPLLSSWRYGVKTRGMSDHTCRPSTHKINPPSWRLTNNSFAPQRVPPKQRCLALQLVCISHITYFTSWSLSAVTATPANVIGLTLPLPATSPWMLLWWSESFVLFRFVFLLSTALLLPSPCAPVPLVKTFLCLQYMYTLMVSTICICDRLPGDWRVPRSGASHNKLGKETSVYPCVLRSTEIRIVLLLRKLASYEFDISSGFVLLYCTYTVYYYSHVRYNSRNP